MEYIIVYSCIPFCMLLADLNCNKAVFMQLSTRGPKRIRPEARAERLIEMAVALALRWGLTCAQRAALFGTPAALSERAWSEDVLSSATSMLEIHQSLRTLFPQNRELAYAWMTRANRAFDGATPISRILADPQRGFAEVKAYLHRAQG